MNGTHGFISWESIVGIEAPEVLLMSVGGRAPKLLRLGPLAELVGLWHKSHEDSYYTPATLWLSDWLSRNRGFYCTSESEDAYFS
jgi:hypothetical protein